MASTIRPRTADSARRHRLHLVVRTVTALGLACFSLPFLTGGANAAPSLGIVIDGDRSDNGGSERDWASLSGGTADYVTYVDPTTEGTGPSARDDDIFQSASENQDPSGWGTRTGSTDTGNDIGDVSTYHVLDDAGHVWFYLGFARQAVGVGAFSVELNKLPDDADAMPVRSVGDVRITFVQDNGNSVLTEFGVDHWTGSGWQAAPLSASDYDARAGEGGLFAELAVDLTSTGLQPPCAEGFTAVNVRSRSSAAETASLKDHVRPLGVDIRARCQDVRVEKFDRTTGAPLSGATFELYADDGDGTFDAGDTRVGAAQTADAGTDGNSHTWSDLTWGTYFVKETGRPTGYESDPDGDVRKVTLGADTPDGVAVATFANPQTGAAIRVAKYDATTGLPLGGARFRLFHDEGDGVFDGDETPVGPVVTADGGADGNQHVWSGPLPYGTYFVKEAARPTGYLMDPKADADGTRGTADDDVKRVVLRPADAGSVVDVAFRNPQVTPTITVTKYDATTGEPLSGAGFRLYADDGDGVFEGGWVDAPVGGELVADGGPDGNRHTWRSGLAWGTYFVAESTVPAGYEDDPTAGVPTPEGTTAADYVTEAATMKAVTVSLESADGEARFDNPRGTAALRVDKWDWTDRDLGLTGAQFQLHRDDDCDQVADSTLGAVVTAAEPPHDGSSLTNSHTWDDVAWGCYVVEETAPPADYTVDPEVADSRYPVTVRRADVGGLVTLDVFNVDEPHDPEPTANRVVVRKYDAERAELLDGATFVLFQDENGNGTGEPSEEVSEAPAHAATGTYEWSGLADGDYLVRETVPPAGFLPPEDDTLGVTVSGGATGSVDFHNAPITSVIEVTKHDETTGALIDTARFQLWRDVDGDHALDPFVDAPVGDPRDTVDGQTRWSGLRIGDYLVEETVAPSGYLLPDTPVVDVQIDLGAAGGTFLRSFDDPQRLSTIEVLKQASDTRDELDGAVFQLYRDVDGSDTHEPVGAPRVTDEDGVASWTDLPFGDYLVLEVSAPSGYSVAKDADREVSFDRDNAGDLVRLVFLNPPVDPTEPPAPEPALPGDVEVTKAVLEKDGHGGWVESDGRASFGDVLQYRLTVAADGPRLHRQVVLSDVLPGRGSSADGTTAPVTLVSGSATCGREPCVVTYDDGTGKLVWALGDLRNTTRTVAFQVRLPELDEAAPGASGEVRETVVNVGHLAWRQITPAHAWVTRHARSNEVVTTIVGRVANAAAETGPSEQTGDLPETGAPSHSGLISLLGGIFLTLGAWLMLVDRRRGLLPRR
jgi:hypothetical protein